ncbi:MAG TPA: OsmC family protein [Candidatus Limnocylindrales bacterium]|nr:OsmC family protein [Candidatus Limnocylindrales bacterium]
MQAITVRHESGDRFEVRIGPHRLAVDQPEAAGGADSAPTPTALFVASAAACAAFYANRFLRRHGLPEGTLDVAADYDLDERPGRVREIRLTITLPFRPDDGVALGLLRAVEGCTIRESLRHPPELRVSLAEKPALHPVAS